MKFLFVRHGETDWNVKKKIQGKTDIPLNKNGERQAEELADKLAKQQVRIARVYTSPQVRAQKTAEAIAKRLQVESCCKDGFREMDLGLWEGKHWEEIQEEYKEEYQYWNAHRRYAKTPEGECYNDVLKRALEALEEIREEETEDVLVVTHSAVVMALFCYIEEEPFEEEIMITRYKLENAEVAEVDEEKILLAWKRFFKLSEEQWKQNTAGIVLSYYREKYQLNQEDICGGICSITTLSKLEAGEREVDSLVCEAMLSRIGKEVNEFEIMLDDFDYQNWQIRNKLLKKMDYGEYEDCDKLLEKYKEVMEWDNALQRQFYFTYKAKYMHYYKQNPREILQLVEKGIGCTMPKTGKRKLYSRTELELEILLNVYLRKTGKQDAYRTEKQMNQLLMYLEYYYSQNQKRKIERYILEELLFMWEEEKNIEKIFCYLERLIVTARKQKMLLMLGDYLFRKVQFVKEIYGTSDEWSRRKADCEEECRMAYYIYLAGEQKEKYEKVQKYCEEELGCRVINQELL